LACGLSCCSPSQCCVSDSCQSCGTTDMGTGDTDASADPCGGACSPGQVCVGNNCVEDLEHARWPVPDSPTVFCTNGVAAATCPTSGSTFGQDGNFQIRVPNHSSGGASIARDSITNL